MSNDPTPAAALDALARLRALLNSMWPGTISRRCVDDALDDLGILASALPAAPVEPVWSVESVTAYPPGFQQVVVVCRDVTPERRMVLNCPMPEPAPVEPEPEPRGGDAKPTRLHNYVYAAFECKCAQLGSECARCIIRRLHDEETKPLHVAIARLERELGEARDRIEHWRASAMGSDVLAMQRQEDRDAARSALDEAEKRIRDLEAENDRLRQDRYDALSVYSKDGMLSSEWIARTGKAERERKEAQSRAADLQAKLTAAEREAETARAKAIEEVKEAIRVQRWAFKNPDARNGLLAALQAVYEIERRDSKAAPGAKEEA